MIGLLFAVAAAAALIVLVFYGARWAFDTDRTPTEKRAEVEAFLRDPLHYGKKGH